MNEVDHLNPNQIAAYVDRGLSAEARDDIERHLDACDDCRVEVSQSAKLADTFTPTEAGQSRPHRKRRWLPIGISGAIAAAALLAFFVNPQRTQNATVSTVERERNSGEGRTTIKGILPAANAVTDAHGMVFRWHSSQAAIYRFTLLTENGEPVFSLDTQDTSASAPDSIVLTSGKNYFWRVDGTENGVVSSTGATPFHVR